MSSLIKWLSKKLKGDDTKTKIEDASTTFKHERLVEPERKDHVSDKTVEFGKSANSIRFGDSQCSNHTIQNDKRLKGREYDGDPYNQTPRDLYGVPSLRHRDTTNPSIRQRATTNREYDGDPYNQTHRDLYGVPPLRHRDTTNPSFRQRAITNPGTAICLNEDFSDFQANSTEKLIHEKTREHVDMGLHVTPAKDMHSSSSHDNKVITSETFPYMLKDTKPSVISRKTDETFRSTAWASWDTPTLRRHKTTIRGANIRSSSPPDCAAKKIVANMREFSNEVDKTDQLSSKLKDHDNTSQSYSFNNWSKVCDFLENDNLQKDKLARGHSEVSSTQQMMKEMDKNQQTGDKLSQKHNKSDETLGTGNIVSERAIGSLEQHTNDTKRRSTERNALVQNDPYKSISLHTVETETMQSTNKEGYTKKYLEQKNDDLQNIADDTSQGNCKVRIDALNMDTYNMKTLTECSSRPESIEKVVNKVAKEWQEKKVLYEDIYRKALQNLQEEGKVVGKSDPENFLQTDESTTCEPLSFVKREDVLDLTSVPLVKDGGQLLTPKEGHKKICALPEIAKCDNKHDSKMLESPFVGNKTDRGSLERYRFDTKNVNNNSNRQEDMPKLPVKSKITNSNYQSEDDVKICKTEGKSDATQLPYASGNSSCKNQISNFSQCDTENRHLSVGINDKEDKEEVASELLIKKEVTYTNDYITVKKDGTPNEEGESNLTQITYDAVQTVCDNPSAICSQFELENKLFELENKLSIKDLTGHSEVENKHSTKEKPGDKRLPKNDSSSSLTQTDESPVPQKLVLRLKMCERENTTNFEHFIKERIGYQIKFKIEEIVVRPTGADVVAVFPSKSASRKASSILHMNNKKHSSKIWCSLYKEKKINENNPDLDKTDSDSESSVTKSTRDDFKDDKTQKIQKSQENSSFVQHKEKCNKRKEPHEATTRDINDSGSPSVIKAKEQHEEKARYKTKTHCKSSSMLEMESTCNTSEDSKTTGRRPILEAITIDSLPSTDAKDDLKKSEHLDMKIDKGLGLKPRKNENTTFVSESNVIKAESRKTDIKSDKGEERNKTNTKSVVQESFLPTKRDEITNLRLLTEEMSSKPTRLKTTDTKGKRQTQISLSDQLEISQRKQIVGGSKERNLKIGTDNESIIPKLEDLAFKAALEARRTQKIKVQMTENAPKISKTLCDKTASEETKSKEITAKTDNLIASNKEIRNKGNEKPGCEVLRIKDNTKREEIKKCSDVKCFQIPTNVINSNTERTHLNLNLSTDVSETTTSDMLSTCDDHIEQANTNGAHIKIESDNSPILNDNPHSRHDVNDSSSIDVDTCEQNNVKSDVKTDTFKKAVTKCDLGTIEVKANTSSKPQALEIEIVNLGRKDSNIERFLLQRLSKPFKFTINEITTIDGVKFLSVEFSSTNSSKQARQLLHKSNSKSRTKVWCSFNNERKQKLKDQRLSKFVNEIADVAKDLIVNHNVNLKEISTYLEAITRNKTKFQTIAEYQREKKETEALTSKLNEMEKQKTEFKTFLSSLYDNLETLKHSEFEEEDLTQRETAFKIECNRFSSRLPIYARRTDIVKIIDENQACVVLGETGSGKSTQIVQYLYQTGRFSQGTIVCTQPRKVAAISLATHVAKEMASNVGHLVGYQVGLHTKKCKETKILYMTDHVLLNECLKDRLLTSFSCIVIDEAHERSIFTDLLLGMIKQCLPLRPDLRVVITSATIEPHIFVQFFGNDCPVLAVSGRTFPVDIEWSEEDCDDNYEERTLQKAIKVHKTEAGGDILAFLTSPLEVEKCCKKFTDRLGSRNDFVCLPLHGKLQSNEQQQVFTPPPRGKRKIVFATNSAETSITIPGIKFVVDSGRIKEMQFNPKKNISSLVVTLVTKSSANQRSGRAGRVAPGKCFRLYSQKDYQDMHACSTPEILRIHLGQALLKLLELSVDPMSFDFVESPPQDQMEKAMDMLESIGAVLNGIITELGKWIAKLPFIPIFGVFVYDALKFNTGLEALVLTACCGSGGSLFYRSGTAKEKIDADKMKIRFSHQGGDILTMLNAYREWHHQPERDKGKWCAQNYVNGKTIKAVRETVTEVLSILRKELQVKLEFKFNKSNEVDVLLQKMLFKTFKHNICCFLGHEKAGYHVIHKSHNVCLFPSSALPSLGLQPEWIVIEQVLNINRDYGVNATPVPVEWIEEGIQDGWLSEFHKEKAEQQKVNLVFQVGLGDRCYRDFVGPRYTRVKELEMTLQNTLSQNIVIVDTDSKLGKICIYASSGLQSILKSEIDNTLVPIQAKYKAEKSEQYLSSTKQGTRVVMSAGCAIADILMSDEYKTVLIVSDPSITSFLTVEDVRMEFNRYGEIENIEMFRYTKNNQKAWGKVTYRSTEQAEFAVEQSKQEEIIARPTGNVRLQNEQRFRAKIEWCRRPSRGCGFVQFIDSRFADNILQDCRSMIIGGTFAQLSYGRNNNDQIYVGKLNKFVNEEVLKNSFLDKFTLNDRDLVRASIVREKIDTSRQEFDIIRRRLDAHLQKDVKDGKYSLQLKPTKPQDFTFLAFASFSKIEEGQEACKNLLENFRPNGEIINTSLTLQASLLVIRAVYEKCSDKIMQTIGKLNKQDGIEIRHRPLRNGNCVIDINCDHVETLHRCRSKLDKITQGLRMTKEEFPNIHELFTRFGRYELKNTALQTKALIIDDYRILEISIFGDRDQEQRTLTILEEYLHNLTLGITKTLTLKGPDKPFGVIKQMFVQYGIDLGKLKRDIRGLNCLQIDLRNHSVSINGSSEAVDKAITEINNVIERLRQTQNCNLLENEEDQCPICFMEIEDGEMYRLESCGHPFCKTCIVPQLESAVGNSDFPISCCKEGCEELWAWQDLTNLSLKSGMSINSLVNRAANSYIAKHDKKYKYCISPDCPSIYRVTSVSDVFYCCECEARICTACHIQYHDGMTCDMVKELKKDSTGIQIWLRKDPHNRKLCPNCGLPIEKISGCNNMLCTKCRRNICWVCLDHFANDGNCYKHLRDVHGGFGGGY